ncbi:cytochrome P450 [Backusella circina FSU 941]|nr:cytochrome P450 [Backusella circina FSU 941]
MPFSVIVLERSKVPSDQITKWHDEYGPIMRVKMGVQEWVFISDPQLAHQVFTLNGTSSSGRPFRTFSTKYYSHGGQGIVFSDVNKTWKEARAAVLAVLAPKNVDQYMSSIENESDSFVERLLEATKTIGSLDPYNFLELNARNIITNVCLGIEYKSNKDPEFILATKISEEGARLSSITMDLPKFLPAFSLITYFLGIEKRMGDYIRDVKDPHVKRMIDAAVIKGGPNVIKAFNEHGFKFTEDERQIIISDLIAAGTETASATMTWLFAIVCNRPEIQEKIQRELDQYIQTHGRIPTFADRLELPYAIAMLKETMRFKSATPFGIPHLATKEIHVSGYTIPAGSVLISSNDHMHTRSGFYENGETFDPERFLGDTRTMFAAANGKVDARDHFNFGWGRRICPGSYLAEVELFCLYVRVFSRCQIEPAKDINGNSTLPDVSKNRYRGITTLPLPYSIRFVERSNRLV